MEQKKNSPLFYEARDAVENGTYLKAKKRHLQIYLAELSIVQTWESDRLCWAAVQRKQEWIQKIKTELQRRKDTRRAHAVSVAKFCAKYILAPLIVLIAAFFALRPFQQADQEKKKMQQSQTSPHQQPLSIPGPSVSPAEQNNPETHKEILTRAQKTLRDKKSLESHNEGLTASNGTLIKPQTAGNLPKVLKSQEIRPNKLVSYFNGALTVHAKYISRDGACLMTNMDSECKFTEVGKLLQIQVGDKKYALRVDDTYVVFKNDTTWEENTATLTILLLSDN